MSHCTQCHALTPHYLCAGCVTALQIELTDVPDLLRQLDITRSRQDQLTDPHATTISRGNDEQPFPYKPHVTETVYVLHHTLEAWALSLGDPLDTTTAGLARYLVANLYHIQVHPDAGQLADETTHAIHHARAAIDRPDDRRLFLGPCDAELTDHTHCRHEVYGVPWRDHAVCEHCGTRHHIATRQQQLRTTADDHTGTAVEIAGFLRITGIQVTPNMIYGLAHRKRLTAAVDTKPPRYRIADVVAALTNRYQRRITTPNTHRMNAETTP